MEQKIYAFYLTVRLNRKGIIHIRQSVSYEGTIQSIADYDLIKDAAIRLGINRAKEKYLTDIITLINVESECIINETLQALMDELGLTL